MGRLLYSNVRSNRFAQNFRRLRSSLIVNKISISVKNNWTPNAAKQLNHISLHIDKSLWKHVNISTSRINKLRYLLDVATQGRGFSLSLNAIYKLSIYNVTYFIYPPEPLPDSRWYEKTNSFRFFFSRCQAGTVKELELPFIDTIWIVNLVVRLRTELSMVFQYLHIIKAWCLYYM